MMLASQTTYAWRRSCIQGGDVLRGARHKPVVASARLLAVVASYSLVSRPRPWPSWSPWPCPAGSLNYGSGGVRRPTQHMGGRAVSFFIAAQDDPGPTAARAPAHRRSRLRPVVRSCSPISSVYPPHVSPRGCGLAPPLVQRAGALPDVPDAAKEAASRRPRSRPIVLPHRAKASPARYHPASHAEVSSALNDPAVRRASRSSSSSRAAAPPEALDYLISRRSPLERSHPSCRIQPVMSVGPEQG